MSGEAVGGAWAEAPPPGHVTQPSAPAQGGGPAQSGKDSRAHTATAGPVSVSGPEVLLTERGASREQAPWSPRQALQAGGMSPGTGSSWQRCYPHPSSPATTPAPGSTRTLVLTCRFETQDIYMYSINNQSLHNSTRLELCKRNRTLTVFNVTRNDTGPYVCEARNPENIIHGDPINLNGLCQENSPALNNEIVIAIMTGILVRLALVTTLGCFVFLKMTRRASGQNDLREQQPPAATLGHGPSGSSVSPASLPSPRPIVPLYEELLYPNTDIYCQIHPKVDVVS